MSILQSLLHSRKFWLAVFGIVQALVLNYFQVPEDIWQSVVGLVMVLIAGIAIEDAGEKSGNAIHIHQQPQDVEEALKEHQG